MGVDTGLFRALVNSSSPISSGSLGEKTGIAPDLLGKHHVPPLLCVLQYRLAVGTVA